MFEDIKKDIYSKELEYTYLSIMSSSLRVGIIGGGKAGLIKAKKFINQGCYVEILSVEFNEELILLKSKGNPSHMHSLGAFESQIQDFDSYSKGINLIKGTYYKEFIMDKHLIIMALDDEEEKNRIKKDAIENFKIYIDSSDYKKGMAVVPVQRESKSISFAINTKVGNPKGAILIAKKIEEVLNSYDDFIEFSGKLRSNCKNIEEYKSEIINFVCSEDFKYIYEKKKDKLVIEMFFEKSLVEKIYGVEK